MTCRDCIYYKDDDLFDKCSRRKGNDPKHTCVWFRLRDTKKAGPTRPRR